MKDPQPTRHGWTVTTGCWTGTERHAAQTDHGLPLGATTTMDHRPLTFERSVVIIASPAAVLAAFFDPAALNVWWDTVRSVTTPRPLGVYAIEWRTTPFSDELLGTLGGVFYGTVMEFRPRHEFFLADAYWLPPESDPFGPMALEVTCRVEGPATRLKVRQSGSDDGARWQRYYALISAGWETSLDALKRYLEQGGTLPGRP